MNLMAKTALKLKMFEQVPKMQEQWCSASQRDMERMFEMVEDLIEKAVNSNNSPMSYQLLTQAKADFVAEVLETSGSYRKVVGTP